jgi:hypothetical protein
MPCQSVNPSATGDIEATLVHGEQGARFLNVLFLSKSSGMNSSVGGETNAVVHRYHRTRLCIG